MVGIMPGSWPMVRKPPRKTVVSQLMAVRKTGSIRPMTMATASSRACALIFFIGVTSFQFFVTLGDVGIMIVNPVGSHTQHFNIYTSFLRSDCQNTPEFCAYCSKFGAFSPLFPTKQKIPPVRSLRTGGIIQIMLRASSWAGSKVESGLIRMSTVSTPPASWSRWAYAASSRPEIWQPG